jgi:hypothetical protein
MKDKIEYLLKVTTESINRLDRQKAKYKEKGDNENYQWHDGYASALRGMEDEFKYLLKITNF